MKSFNTVYNKERNIAINEQRSAADNDRAKLLVALKKEYGINDFSALSEEEKASFKNIINEMWDKTNGLNEKGMSFVNEAMKPLTEMSTDEMIDNYIIKSLKPNAHEIVKDLILDKESRFLADVKVAVERDTKKKISKKRYVGLIGKVILPYLGKKVNSIKF
jgi:hypothetical protein